MWHAHKVAPYPTRQLAHSLPRYSVDSGHVVSSRALRSRILQITCCAPGNGMRARFARLPMHSHVNMQPPPLPWIREPLVVHMQHALDIIDPCSKEDTVWPQVLLAFKSVRIWQRFRCTMSFKRVRICGLANLKQTSHCSAYLVILPVSHTM